MLGPVRNQIAMYLDAGNLFSFCPFLTSVDFFVLIIVIFSLQGPKGTSEKVSAAIRITAQSSSDGDDETESCRSRWDLQLINLYIYLFHLGSK